MKPSIQEYLLENLFDGVYYVNKNRKITYWNKSAERITGYSKDEVIGKSCAENILRHIDINGNELCVTGCPLHKTIKDGKIRDVDAFLHNKEGHRLPISVRVSPVRNESGTITGAVEIFNDKSEKTDAIRYLEKIRKETLIDPITKLGNRKYAQATLNNRYSDLKLYKVHFGVLLIAVNNLSNIQTAYGGEIADRVMEMAAKTTKHAVNRLDAVCRWDSTQLIVIVPNIDNIKTLTVTAERIRKFVKSSWLHHEGELLTTTVSVGGTISKKEDTIPSLLERAARILDGATTAPEEFSRIG